MIVIINKKTATLIAVNFARFRVEKKSLPRCLDFVHGKYIKKYYICYN